MPVTPLLGGGQPEQDQRHSWWRAAQEGGIDSGLAGIIQDFRDFTSDVMLIDLSYCQVGTEVSSR